MREIDLNDYDYDLPENRIAQHPVNERDLSQLLVYNHGILAKDIFRNLSSYLPSDSLLVFNNTRVIRARIFFQKDSGATIEVLCLEPLTPPEYELSLSSEDSVEWKCIIGNLKKWKSGFLTTPFIYNDKQYILKAEKIQAEKEAWRIRFSWDCKGISFGKILDTSGHIPLPPYINREDEVKDLERYQTIYSSISGSVAAPTAGLHFTDKVLEGLKAKGIKSTEITLHVGAGTFQPVKSKNIYDHEMHCEHFFVTANTLETLLKNEGKIIAVGTTSVRTIESLYWLGVKLINNPSGSKSELSLEQWEVYNMERDVSLKDSLEALLNFMKDRTLSFIHASTSIMIVPGYNFMMINGIITNFHQPKSTLLLLISAWIGNNWKKTYKFALENNFRFLSYGDCSLFFR